MRNKKHCYLIFHVVLLLLLSTQLQAVTWNGGGATSDWNEALNWDTGMVPTSSDAVIIGAFTVNIPTGFTAEAHDVTLNGSTLNIAATGGLFIDTGSTYALVINDATVTNEGNITITNCAGGVQLLGSSAALLDNRAIFEVVTYSGDGIKLETSTCSFVNSGNVAIDGGTNANSSAISNDFSQPAFANSGIISIGSTANAGGGISAKIGGTYSNSGTINITNTGAGKSGIGGGFFAPTWNNSSSGVINLGAGIGGSVIGNANLALQNNGIVNINKAGNIDIIASGTGSFGGSHPLSNVNQILPGNSAGCLGFNKGLEIIYTGLLAASKVGIELGGTTPCSQHDKINVTGTATIAGRLVVSLINGFTPTAGQSFTILSATSLNGTFSIVNFPTVSNINWSIAYTSTSVVITASAVLVVELTNFNVSLSDKNTAKLHWQTATETNNKGFFIEKSVDGHRWSIIDFVEGEGTTSAIQHYFYEDQKMSTGINYYRLKQVDFDDSFEYSVIRKVHFSGQNTLNSAFLFPNPTKDIVHIKGLFSPSARILLFNQRGEFILEKKLNAGNQIDIANFPQGLYLLQIIDKDEAFTQKITKL